MTDLGEIIRELREGLGLTQSAFAQAVGLTNVAMSYIETGKTQPSYATLRRIEERYKVEFEIKVRWVPEGVTR